MGTGDSTTDLMTAIYEDRLAGLDDPVAARACTAIGHRVAEEVELARAVLAERDVAATVEGEPAAPAQRHWARLTFHNQAAADVAIDALTDAGYRPWDAVHGPAGVVRRRLRGVATLARNSDVTMVLEIGWPPEPPPILDRLPAAAVPTDNDFDVVSLPEALWPLYYVVRPFRLLAERVGLLEAGARRLGPFLSTPHDVLPTLHDLADLTADDVLVDLGCGDGHVLIHAATTRGCRGIGVERDPDLVAAARAEVKEHGLSDRIEIHQGDATSGSLPAGTVYFIFVPAEAACNLAARVLRNAGSGTRVLVHEQHPLPKPPPGAESQAVISGQGVTVAHLWSVP